jgi:hypothetical protein
VVGASETEGSGSRSGSTVQVKGDNVPKGIRYVRFLGAKYLASSTS